ncbi:MAG: hypothetical protein DRG82_11760 [Deltaproteobacteria bacterium]|nr:MAG: hypothetical protein DRG82_11760 [Deltaproteobacteria bacterium]
MSASLNRIGTLWVKTSLLAMMIMVMLPVESRGRDKIDMAIYNDSFCKNKGVWREGIVFIKSMLNKYGYSFFQGNRQKNSESLRATWFREPLLMGCLLWFCSGTEREAFSFQGFIWRSLLITVDCTTMMTHGSL